MRMLYIMAALMMVGIFLMLISSYRILNEIEPVKEGTPQAEPVTIPGSLQPYVMASYLGLTFFIVGALGAVFYLFRAMNRNL